MARRAAPPAPDDAVVADAPVQPACDRCGRSDTAREYFACDRCGGTFCELCWGWAAAPELCAPCSMETGPAT